MEEGVHDGAQVVLGWAAGVQGPGAASVAPGVQDRFFSSRRASDESLG
ncbi:hypothetical protein ACFHW2_31840 [Actinomadura sp. LOL_016]